jgi:hypothetical protein
MTEPREKGNIQFKYLAWIAIVLVLVVGLMLGINHLLSVRPEAGEVVPSSQQDTAPLVDPTPERAAAQTTSAIPIIPGLIGPNTNHQEIRQRLLEPLWDTLWVESQSLYYEPDGQIMVTHSQAWLDRDGGGRVIRTDPQPYSPISSYFDLTPSQVRVSDGQNVDLFDQQSGQFVSQDAGRNWIMHPLEENLGMLFPSHLALRSEDVQVGQVSEQAGRTALMVRWAKYQLWVDVETGVILREQVFDPNRGLLSEQIIGDIVYNPTIPGYIFSRDQIDRARFEPAPTARFELPAGSRTEILTYTVQADENLFSIADRFRVAPESVFWSNGHLLQNNPDNLQPGMELLIPPVDGIVYRWQAGDDLIAVAIGYGVSPADVLNWPGNASVLGSRNAGHLPDIALGSWVFIPAGQREIHEIQAPDALQDYPLTPGTTWVYRYDEYQSAPQDATHIISATSLLTETVINNRYLGDYYLAQVGTSRKFVSMDEEWVENGDVASTSWYAIDGGRIYESSLPLDIHAVDMANLKLLYDLPLFDGQSWCPYDVERSSSNPEVMQNCSGRSTVQAIGRLDTPAGAFEDCYEIIERYNNGSVIKRFCNGVGLVSTHFDHVGSRFGFHEELQDFTRDSP